MEEQEDRPDRYRIGDRGFHFAAAHRVSGDRSSGRVHGHTFTVEVELAASELRAPGFVVDFGDLAPVGRYLRATLDHRDLDAALAFQATTDRLSDHLSSWFGEQMPGDVAGMLRAVRVVIGDPATALGDQVAQRVRFEAAHRLDGLPDGHKCSRLHGHSYAADLRLGPDTGAGTPERLHALLAEFVSSCWDRRLLNDVVPVAPTSELLAKHLCDHLAAGATPVDVAALVGVRVWESPHRWAEYVPGQGR